MSYPWKIQHTKHLVENQPQSTYLQTQVQNYQTGISS